MGSEGGNAAQWLNLIGGFVCIFIGIVLAGGTLRRHTFFMRPIDRVWKIRIYPDAWLKGSLFNERFFYAYHLAGGAIFILVGLVSVVVAFR